jgi:ATP-dependent DNA helicase RecG
MVAQDTSDRAEMVLPPDLKEQDDRLAFLPEKVTRPRLAETLVALANARGGTLLIGIDSRSGQPQGLSNPGRTLDLAVQAALSTDPPLIVPLPEIEHIEETPVLVVSIPRGMPNVYSYRGKFLIRQGGANRPLDPRRLRRLMLERGAVSFEALVADGATLDDLDWDKVENYTVQMSGLKSVGPREALLRRGCLAERDGALAPTHAGLLLFGLEPQRWLRSSEILLVRYSGTAMGDRFLREEARGTLPEQIRRAEAFVLDNMRRGVRLLGLERLEEGEYPAEAVREAIVNAIAHRDYQIRGDQIRVLMFSDRIEFYSPGRLPGHITVDNLVDERFSRNEAIVQILSDMGFIERLGYGIDRMISLMARAGLPAPSFAETAAGFQVILAGQGSALLSRDVDDRRWRHLGLNERQEAALAYLAAEESITNREYQQLCPDVSAETIRRDLADLVQRDLVLKIGRKRGTYYILK